MRAAGREGQGCCGGTSAEGSSRNGRLHLEVVNTRSWRKALKRAGITNFRGTTCATPGRAGRCSAACRSSSCRNWVAGSSPRWCGGRRTCHHRSMRAMRRRSFWSLRGIPSRAAAVYSRASNWHHEQCSATMHVAGGRATQPPVSLSLIAKSKHFICLKTMTTQAITPVRSDCFAPQLPAYTTKRWSTSR